MRIDFATLAFGYRVRSGGNTPNWATALGQGKDYKINDDPAINELLKGMVYSATRLENVSTKVGKGGRVVRGSDPDSPIVLAASFSKVYINDTFIENAVPNGKFILLITKDTSESHTGRLRLKYSPSNTITDGANSYSNQHLFDQIRRKLGLADDACWFISEINVVNQSDIVLKTIVVNPNGIAEYADAAELHAVWNGLAPVSSQYDIKTGENIIFYGVPGSGKSYTIRENYCDDENYMERIVFHPDYSYSDFVGQILPENTDGHISYPFVPGPFTRILKTATNDPAHNYYLIIEELNRGNAPAIFGEVFQLLDRIDGVSEYGINNTDIANEVYGDPAHLVRIPRNLFILATMNTADQNVFTLDTAFKRRWRMKNIASNVSKSAIAKDVICDSAITWEQFVETLNPLIIENSETSIGNADKRMGAYFVALEELKNKDYFGEKVLMYLWNDVFTFNHDKIFKPEYKTLEQLLEGFRKIGFKVFNDSVRFDPGSTDSN